jgi:transcriptional regulator with XRE-family HTH domain
VESPRLIRFSIKAVFGVRVRFALIGRAMNPIVADRPQTVLIFPQTGQNGPSLWGVNGSEDFPQQFVRARKHANLSQQALADALGVDKGTVKRWEGGGLKNPMPRYQRRGLIAEVLEITGAPLETFTEPPAVDRVADLEARLEATNAALRDLAARQLDEDEETEWQRYLATDSHSVEQGRGGVSG